MRQSPRNLLAVLLALWCVCGSAQRMNVFNSPYAIRLDEAPPADRCLEVGWCRDALAYLTPGSMLRWCGWGRSRCLSVRASSADPRVPIEVDYMTVDAYSLWSGRQLNYTAKNAFRVNGTSCRGTNCHVRYGPVPGLLSNETYCVLISRAPNATYNGSRTGEPQVLTVQYRARTDCGAAGAMRIMAWLLLACAVLALVVAR